MTKNYEKHITLDCDFTDQLEFWSMHRKHLEITIRNSDHSHVTLHGTIEDIFAEDHKEHIKLHDGRIFELAQITGVKELEHKAK